MVHGDRTGSIDASREYSGRRAGMSAIVRQFTTLPVSTALDLAQPVELVDPLLDSLRDAVVLGGRDAQVLRANTAARDLLAANDGLCLRAGRLVACHDQAASALRRAWSAALDGCGACPGTQLLEIMRPSRKPAFQLLLTGSTSRLAANGEACIVVRMFDPAILPRFDAARLRSLYQLTHSEAVVAIAIAQGQDIAAIAADTGRKPGTVRTLLKRAFAKTGTCRQNALAAVLWAGAAGPMG